MKLSIKWKIFIYMLGFTAVLLGLLWLFQTVYLDEFYKNIKTNELEDACESVVAVLDDVNANEAIEAIGASYDVCVRVTDAYGNDIYESEQNMQCNVHKLRRDQLLRLITEARANGGSYQAKVENEVPDFFKYNDKGITDMENLLGKDMFANMPRMTEMESIISVEIVRSLSGQELVVMVNTIITPVDATVHTLRIQLIYISIIMVVLSLIIAIVISIRISKPIIKINESAKKLGKGEYDVRFEGDSYREIAQLSETLNQAAVELAKAEGLQRELIANVSHDLRTPLTMITAYSEIMRDLPGENSPENVQVIIDEAKRLTSLVNDLLDVSKLQAGVMELNLKEYDLTASIESVLTRYSKFLEQNGYTVDFEYDRNILVVADEDKMYQVIYNLVNNAINYTGEDKKIIVRQRVAGSIARIEVIDTGEGIAPEELTNVWERYYKVDKNHKRAVMGTGLGLSIVKNVLKLHDLSYGVNSEVGKGTCFWFEISLKEERNGYRGF
ncbi:MAG: ATP-binding protein [Lachnospiraceae bacterium]|nr:ATP-binding protein [Lachnospiraceae bacterium]MEE0861759.1 ATP-binding protein [Lachnospiraceae bacterium]